MNPVKVEELANSDQKLLMDLYTGNYTHTHFHIILNIQWPLFAIVTSLWNQIRHFFNRLTKYVVLFESNAALCALRKICHEWDLNLGFKFYVQTIKLLDIWI